MDEEGDLQMAYLDIESVMEKNIKWFSIDSLFIEHLQLVHAQKLAESEEN